jgi:hypothetical protein
MEDLRERQENEITVLKSIYLDECVEIKDEKKAIIDNKKKQQSPVDSATILKITLHPQNSQSQNNFDRESYVQIDLKIKIVSNYPNE